MPTEIITSLLRELRHAGLDDLFTTCALHESELAVFAAVMREAAPDAALLVAPDAGTLAIAALHAQLLYVTGADPVRAAQLERRLPHVRFVRGEGVAAVNAALVEVARAGRHLDFVFLSGAPAGGAELSASLTLPLQRPRTVLVRDSAAPATRRVMTALDWAGWKAVHEVEFDFVPGAANAEGAATGGLARIRMRPDARPGGLGIGARAQASFEPRAPKAAPETSLYAKFSEMHEAELLARLQAPNAAAAADDPAFLAVRARLLPRIADWKRRGARVAIYGAGKHTLALFGLVPELYAVTTLFLDRTRTAPLLGRPCSAPAAFNAGAAEAVVYSSRAAEQEMFAAFRSHAVEHVLLYDTAAAAAPGGESPVLAARLEKAQAQLTELQLSVATLTRNAGRAPEPQDLQFAVVHQHLQLGVRYAVSCAVPGDIAEFGTMAGRTASVIAEAMKTYGRFTPHERKALHLFDSFRGLPAAASEVDRVSPHVASGVWGEGTCLGISEQDLVQRCAQHLDRDRIRTYAGWFSETLPLLPDATRFALLHVDCDLYQSTKDVLDQCFGRGLVSAGAAVFFDDWNCNAARPDLGERRAWAEAVRDYAIEATDCGEYGMGCRKFVVHAYTPRHGDVVRSAPARQLTVSG